MRVILLDEDAEILGGLVEYNRDWFTTVVRRGYVEGRTGLVLVSFGTDLERLGRLEKTRAVATRKDGVRCSDLTEIDPPLSLEELAAEMPANVRARLDYRTLPDRTGRETLAAVARLRPYLDDTIRSLERHAATPEANDSATGVLAMEKDAVGLAMDISGVDKVPLTQWGPETAQSRPFLAGLQDVALREDPMINHDANVFGDWEVVRRSAVGSVHFKNGNRSLTVINVNRQGIENTTGVDLVYYNETFHAFVLVQYKRMHRGADAGWLYRPDANHDVEVERMAAIPARAAEPLDAKNYRLDPAACFFKLCESVVFDPFAPELLRGMYLPLEYFNACATSALGARGGVAYGYATVSRHLNNTLFVQLVQDGWIGSAGTVSDELRTFVEARVQDGRSVMLAFGTGASGRARR